jgi:hypothetical protein
MMLSSLPRTSPEIALSLLCQLKICLMIFMSNFSHKIFQSDLSLLLSKSQDTIGNDDVIAFKYVSKLNATVFKMCEEN